MIAHLTRWVLTSVAVAAVAATLSAADEASQPFFAYEGFDYMPTQAPPLNGGVGWASAWQGSIRLSQPAYGYNSIEQSGAPIIYQPGPVTTLGLVHAANASRGAVIKRRLAAPLTECWVSMLVSMKGAGSYISFDHFDGNAEQSTFLLEVNGAGHWVLVGSNDEQDTGVRADVNGPRLLVVHLTGEAVELYINPAYGWESPPQVTPHARLDISDLGDVIVRLEQLSFYAADQLKLDEIRVASDYASLWDDVLPPLPSVSLQVIDGVAGEPDNRAAFRIVATGLSQQPLVVQLEYAGDAIANVDYQALPYYFTIPAGMLSNWVDVTVVPVDDDRIEDTETLIVRLKRDGRYQFGEQPEIAIEIDDDDQLPRVLVTATDASAKEASWPVDYATFTVTRSGLLDRSLTVLLRYSGSAIPGVDYQRLPETITFAPGETSVPLVVRPINDGLVEGNESIVVEIIPQPQYLIQAPRATAWIIETEQGSGATATDAAVAPFGEGCGAGGALALLVLPFTMTIIPRRR